MLQRFSFALILVLALCLRLINLGEYGLNTDEKFTLLNIHGICVGGYNQPELYDKEVFTPEDYWKDRNLQDYYQAVARADFGTHITHNTLMHVWVKVFGKSDIAMRLMSVLFSMLLLVIIFWFCKDLLDSVPIGLWAMFFVAIDPLLVSQAHFARSYSLSFFLLVLASYLFLKLLKSDSKNVKLAILYAAVASLSLLNHYLNFVILLVHVVIAVVYLRNAKKWYFLLGAGAFTLAVMAYWMLAGGGQWSMQFLEDKNALHLALSKLPYLENPMRGIVEPSTLTNVSKMASSMILDANVFSFDFLPTFNGIRNLSIFIVFASASLISLVFFKKYSKFILGIAVLVAAGAGILFFNGFDKTVLLRGLLLFAVIYGVSLSKIERKNVVFLILASILPLLYVIFDAFKSGHTTSLSHRYIANSIPFIAMLMAVGFYGLIQNFKPFTPVFILLLALQLFPLGKELNLIFEDVSARYSFRTEARIPNPYWAVAEKVKSNYSKGDSLILPSFDGNVYTGHLGEAEKPKSILDAQYLNIYFEPNDDFIQRIDQSEPNKVFLQKENGERLLLFDFNYSKYRY